MFGKKLYLSYSCANSLMDKELINEYSFGRDGGVLGTEDELMKVQLEILLNQRLYRLYVRTWFLFIQSLLRVVQNGQCTQLVVWSRYVVLVRHCTGRLKGYGLKMLNVLEEVPLRPVASMVI